MRLAAYSNAKPAPHCQFFYAGKYHAMSVLSMRGEDGQLRTGHASDMLSLVAGAAADPEPESSQEQPNFANVAMVQPFGLAAVQKSIDAGEAPIYRLSDVERAAAKGTKAGAIAARLTVHGGAAVHAGQCVLLQLAYEYAVAGEGSPSKVR